MDAKTLSDPQDIQELLNSGDEFVFSGVVGDWVIMRLTKAWGLIRFNTLSNTVERNAGETFEPALNMEILVAFPTKDDADQSDLEQLGVSYLTADQFEYVMKRIDQVNESLRQHYITRLSTGKE